MIYALKVPLKINPKFQCIWVKVPYGSYPKKNNTGTETHRLVYNKFKIDNNYANKTRR